MPQATRLSPKALTEAAKALIQTYNDKNWDKAKASITPDFVYDEVATGRKLTGIDDTIGAWQAWAEAFPDSRAVFGEAHASDDGTVVLELTWKRHAPGAPADAERFHRAHRQAHRAPGLRGLPVRRREGQGPAPLLRHGNAAAANRVAGYPPVPASRGVHDRMNHRRGPCRAWPPSLPSG
ncbi:MAG: nuclear transport factor 2 family protein [Gemmatimonadales bacterium]|nr:nuclear transport factor 2 family protein [Gemmatimonadales bacterium]